MTEPAAHEPAPSATATVTAAPARPRTALRLGLLIALTVALVAVGHFTGAAEHLSLERVRTLMSELGVLGLVAFVALFTIGELVHVPGMAFVLAAILAYGPLRGFAAGLGGAIVSLSLSFWIVRAVGGQPLGAIERPFMRRVLARLDTRPVATIAILRLLFQMLPALNYGLAMSKVRYRDYLVGSVVGLVPWIALAAVATDWFVATFLS